jgi:DNA-binding MarR family transcriptional regulator
MSRNLAKRQHTVNADEGEPAHRTREGEAFTQLVVQIFRLNGLLSNAGEDLAAPAGQTSARWRVLAAVDDAPLTVAQIARRWGLARQSVQRIADELAGDRLCVYEENPDHRRAKLLRLTPKGRARLRAIQTAQRAWADGLGETIGEADLKKANAAIQRVLGVLEARATGAG